MAKKAYKQQIKCDKCNKIIKMKRCPKRLITVKGREILLYFCSPKCWSEYVIEN